MAGWFAEMRHARSGGIEEDWRRIGAGPFPHQERAKAECRKELQAAADKRLEFRTVVGDACATVYQTCRPPHAWRLRWRNA